MFILFLIFILFENGIFSHCRRSHIQNLNTFPEIKVEEIVNLCQHCLGQRQLNLSLCQDLNQVQTFVNYAVIQVFLLSMGSYSLFYLSTI